MSIFIQNNHGTINHIENSTVTINNYDNRPPSDDRVQTANADRVQTEDAEEQHFALLTAQCIQEGKTQAVEAELRSAASGSAQKLMQCIRTNEALGYINTKNLSSQALYDAMNDYFGLKYSVRNFTIARNK